MTFTNKAAEEMRTRLESMIGAHAHEPVVTTFHSLCARMLRRSQEFLLPHGVTSAFTIADDHDQERLFRQIIRLSDMDLSALGENQQSAGSLQDLVSRAKSAMLTPKLLEQQAEQERNISKLLLARIFHKYDRLLRKQNLLDFDDLLTFTVLLLRSEKAVRGYYQQRWRYIHIDEFQDTNVPRYEIIRLLAYGTDDQQAGHRNICVVADDDQMIYTWRGASAESIDRFERDFQERALIFLEQNYRSTRTIVEAASRVVQGNASRRAKNLWTANAQGEPVILVETENEEEEARYVMRTIEQLLEGNKALHYRDIAVLYRTNAQSREIEESALSAAIPYRIIGATMFYQRKEIRDFLAYLRILLNPLDDLCLERIINSPRRGIGEKTISLLREWAASHSYSLSEALEHLHEWAALEALPRKALATFAHLLSSLREAMWTYSLPDFLDQVAHLTGLERALREGPEEARERWENVAELKQVALRFAGSDTPQALSLFLEHVALMSGAEKVEESRMQTGTSTEDSDMITLITLHSAKGAEYPVVFLVGVEEGLLPHSRSFLPDADAESISEERRLMYVGMTRAMHELYCVRATQRVVNRKTVRAAPSRFLSAIPSPLRQTLSW
jgi:DNA helicase-2/ATP-dependent DNA helicase PcrA